MLHNIRLHYYLFLLFPILLITGPALPDILLTFFVISLIIFKKNLVFKIYEPWMLFLIILWIWFLIISFFAYNFEKSIIESIIFLRFILFIILCYLVFKEINVRKINILLFVILISCIFVSLDSLYQFYNYSYREGFGSDIFGRKPDGLYGRLSGPFADLVPGSYLSRLIFFIFVLYILNIKKINKNNLVKYFFYLSLSLILSVIYFSGERMAISTTLLGLLICFVFTTEFRKIILLSLFISISFIIINLNLHPHYKNTKIISSLPSHEGLIIERKFECEGKKVCTKKFKVQPSFIEILKNFNQSAYGEIYMSALHMWSNNIFSGIGLNNFNLVCENEIKYKKYNKVFGCTTHPHNFYIQALTEAGVIGLLIFILSILSIFLKINSIYLRSIKLPLISAYLSIFWPIMSTGSFLKNWNMVFICFVISLCLIISREKKLN